MSAQGHELESKALMPILECVQFLLQAVQSGTTSVEAYQGTASEREVVQKVQQRRDTVENSIPGDQGRKGIERKAGNPLSNGGKEKLHPEVETRQFSLSTTGRNKGPLETFTQGRDESLSQSRYMDAKESFILLVN